MSDEENVMSDDTTMGMGDDAAGSAGDDSASSDDSVMSEDTPMSAPASHGSTITNPGGDDPNFSADSEFVEFVVKQIVDNPSEVVVERKIDDMGVLIELKVSKDDMGKIIGKEGQTAKAIRTLLRIIGSKNNARVNLKIVEPQE